MLEQVNIGWFVIPVWWAVHLGQPVHRIILEIFLESSSLLGSSAVGGLVGAGSGVTLSSGSKSDIVESKTDPVMEEE